MNSRVNEAYNKLNGTQINYLTMMSELIQSAREKGLEAESENRRGKVRGYLTALVQMQIITNSDLQALYLFFVTADRSY